jgi:hypothetical protein
LFLLLLSLLLQNCCRICRRICVVVVEFCCRKSLVRFFLSLFFWINPFGGCRCRTLAVMEYEKSGITRADVKRYVICFCQPFQCLVKWSCFGWCCKGWFHMVVVVMRPIHELHFVLFQIFDWSPFLLSHFMFLTAVVFFRIVEFEESLTP